MVLKLDGAGQNGLEEDKITWYSNIRQLANQTGLEGCEIAWFSNNSVPFICYTLDLEGCEIAGCSNIGKSKSRCFVRKQNYMVLKPYSR